MRSPRELVLADPGDGTGRLPDQARSYLANLDLLAAARPPRNGIGSASGPDPSTKENALALSSPSPDVVLFNGQILTVDKAFRIVDAIAVQGDRIAAVGPAAKQAATRATEMVDLRGATVIPGLIDSHLHGSVSGLCIGGVDLSEAESIDDVLAAISDRVRVTPPGEWVRSHPCWIESQLKEGRFPTPEELDGVSPNHPVYLQRTGFTVVLNSYAKKTLGITKAAVAEPGTAIIRDPNTGEPVVFIGHLRSMPSLETVATEAEWIAAVEAVTQHLNSVGITSYTEAGAPPLAMGAYQTLWSQGKLTTRVNMMLRRYLSTGGHVSLGVPGFMHELGISSGFGDSMLRLSSIGHVGMRDAVPGALMREPYTWMDGDQKDYYGVDTLADGPDGFRDAAVLAAKRNWRLGLNACGDAQLDWALDLFEHINREVPTAANRHIAVHPFLVHDDQLERIKELGLVVQSEGQGYLFAQNIVKYWGRDRAERAFPTKRLFDNDIVVGLGSDGPVLPDNPFLGMWYFITRNTVGGVLGADQALTREQALRGYTINGAYLTCEEDIKGSLETGKFADLVVLSDDILACPEEAIRKIKPIMTMVGGRIVYDARNAH